MNENIKPLKFVVSGGGTGGHIYPAIAIAKMLLDKYPGCDLSYVGSEGGMEQELVVREGIKFYGISAAGLKREISLKVFDTAKKTFSGFLQSKKIIKKIDPDLVIGTGGYVSGPVLYAAVRLKVPIMIHEQNVYPGITNRALSKHAVVSAVSWEESEKYLRHKERTVLTGNPLRPEILEVNKKSARIKIGILEKSKLVLVFGGSQGSQKINETIVAMSDCKNRGKYDILLVSGKARFEEVIKDLKDKKTRHDIIDSSFVKKIAGSVNGGNLYVAPYMYDMASAMAASDIVVSRSGAITMAELAAIGIPSILIPHPYVPDNVQEKNARVLESAGGCKVILNSELKADVLDKEIASLIFDDNAYSLMAECSKAMGIRDSLKRIGDAVDAVVRTRKSLRTKRSTSG